MLKTRLRNIFITSMLASTLFFNYTVSNAASYKVFIDPGHGGVDNGSSYYGYKEDALNLQISKKLESKLMLEGINVDMSRYDDTYVSLSKRVTKSNDSDADMFISIHLNASLNKKANGIETYYLGEKNKDLANTIHKSLINHTNANDRGIKIGNFQVLRSNKKPSVLLECGFISNPSESYKLNTKDYQDKLVDAIVDGIKDYLNISNSNILSLKSTKNNKSNYAIALNDVNVMSDRGKNFNVIGTLSKGTKVEIIDTKFDWHKIKYNGRYGYVSGVYVK